ncbi:MAG: signal peptidase I [Ignavibacteriales bacterium]|nr:signal peptidase I [Ignavibacteriales bacterium]
MFFQNEDDSLGAFFLVICFLVLVVYVAALWKVFAKAGEPGWAAIVPIYNLVVLLKIAGKPLWWIILLIIPLVNLIIDIIVSIEIAKKFGKGVGFGLGLALLGLIFYPILGFGDAQYIKGQAMGQP